MQCEVQLVKKCARVGLLFRRNAGHSPWGAPSLFCTRKYYFLEIWVHVLHDIVIEVGQLLTEEN